MQKCREVHPELEDVGGGRHVACHLWREIQEREHPTAPVDRSSENLTQRLEIYRAYQAKRDKSPATVE